VTSQSSGGGARPDRDRIRNFCIIAHIDHGKSTLADRLLELTGALPGRVPSDQVLDQMDLERERGITIKAKATRLPYRAADGRDCVLNLIDTPGHVDFSYEVSRTLAACEGALLVVDASQGVEAQTVANLYLALDHNLDIIPVVNKIDLPGAEPGAVARQLTELGFDEADVINISAKTGEGVTDVLQAIVDRVPAPKGDPEAPLRALVFDSHFDPYRGVIVYVRVFDGRLEPGMKVRMMRGGKTFEVSDVGVFVPEMKPTDGLGPGSVGFFAAAIKNVRDSRVGDTVTEARRPAPEPLPGYRPAVPMVFCGLYPVEAQQYDDLREALEKLQLNDAAFSFEPETSLALGFGFRCGFLGLLHLDIARERLEREYGLELVTTAPNVVYRVTKTDGGQVVVDNPAKLPPPNQIEKIEEPVIKAGIITPQAYVGPVMELSQERRSEFVDMEYLEGDRVQLTYRLPLAEMMYDFFDQLKSRTRGYASLDYVFDGYQGSGLVKMDILVNGEPVDALSVIVHRDDAQQRGRQLVDRLRRLIPRQLFDVPIQAAVGGRVIARETIRAVKKDVLAKCYGGDVTRKRKLLERQKEGKRRMKLVGNVEIPQEAFMAVLEVD